MTIERDDLNGAEHDKRPTHRLENLEVYKVDLVKRPATGDAFLAIRSEEGSTDMARRAMSVEQFRRQYRQVNDSVVVAQRGDPVARQVPDADATSDEKREAQKARSDKYGIEALEGKGENLSYPSDDPTIESLYGDPVNLKYPLGYDDNELSLERANNARSRFKQAADTYSEEKSKAIIHERIVEAQIKAGASPSYDENDPLDELLPQKTVDKLQQGVERNTDKIGESEMKALLERIEGLTSQVAALTEKVDAKPDAETTSEPDQAPQDTETKPATETAAVESTQTTQSTQSVTEPAAEPAATMEPPVETQAVERVVAAVETLTTAMDAIARGSVATGKALEAVNVTVEGLSQQMDALAKRMNGVERGLTTSNADPQDRTEREDGGSEQGSPFDGLLFGGRM